MEDSILKSKSLLRLIVLVAGGELFINNLTPGNLTLEEIILDSLLLLAIIICVCYNKRLHVLAQRLPFIEEVLDAVEECCNEKEDCKWDKAEEAVKIGKNNFTCTCNNEKETLVDDEQNDSV